MSPDPWLMTQVRRRASQLVEDWSERVYVRCVVDEPTAAQPSRCDVVATVALGEP